MRRRSLYRTGRPLGPLASAYLQALLGGERERAMSLMLRAESRGMTPRRLCASVFLPVRHELRTMYITGRISRAVVDYVAFEMEAAVAHLFALTDFPRHVAEGDRCPSIGSLAAGAEGSLGEIGGFGGAA